MKRIIIIIQLIFVISIAYPQIKYPYNWKQVTDSFTRDYSSIIKSYVEQKINSWQKKGEFEKTSEYHKRVNESTRKEKIIEFTTEICNKCLEQLNDQKLIMTLGEYDADNESFLISTNIGNIVLPIPIAQAPSFKTKWINGDIVTKNSYDIVNGKVVLRSSTFLLKKR